MWNFFFPSSEGGDLFDGRFANGGDWKKDLMDWRPLFADKMAAAKRRRTFQSHNKKKPFSLFYFFLLPTSLFLPIYTYSPSLSVTSKFNCELIGAREPARRGSHVNFFTTGTHSWADLYELGYCLGKIPWVQLIYTDEAHWKEFWLNESASGILPPTLPTGPCQKSFSSSSLSISPYGDHMDW